MLNLAERQTYYPGGYTCGNCGARRLMGEPHVCSTLTPIPRECLPPEILEVAF